MEMPNLEKAIEHILQQDSRYHREAYLFVREALDYTQKNVVRSGKEGIRHVRGQELLDGIRSYGLQVYGPMTMMVFGEWGIESCEDFGEIVFNMVECGLLAKTDADTRADFKGGYEFKDAFRKPFLPKSRVHEGLAYPESEATSPSS